jgi:hypothetical protein
VRTVNAFMIATYWKVVRRIVEFEQGGEKRTSYGEELLDLLAVDFNSWLDRGFCRRNLQSMLQFYGFAPAEQMWQTLTAKLAVQLIPSKRVVRRKARAFWRLTALIRILSALPSQELAPKIQTWLREFRREHQNRKQPLPPVPTPAPGGLALSLILRWVNLILIVCPLSRNYPAP